MTATARPGDRVDHAPGLDDLAGSFNLRVSTDRYRSWEYADRERDAIWLKTWQRRRARGRPAQGRRLDGVQDLRPSFLIVRGKDEKLRGFVNACRHRGNAIRQGRTGTPSAASCASTTRSYDLDGRLKGLLREESSAAQERQLAHRRVGGHLRRLHLHQPGPRCPAAGGVTGEDALAILAPYHLELMSTVMNVSEPLDCNWKVVMDAFNEGYHVNGVHPQLLAVLNIQPETTRYNFYENHSIAMAPFEVVGATPPKSRSRAPSHCPRPSPARSR